MEADDPVQQKTVSPARSSGCRRKKVVGVERVQLTPRERQREFCARVGEMYARSGVPEVEETRTKFIENRKTKSLQELCFSQGATFFDYWYPLRSFEWEGPV